MKFYPLFYGAFSFFSILPLPSPKDEKIDFSDSLPLFPFVGTFFGIIHFLLLALFILIFNFSDDLSIFLSLFLMVILGGFLHEDALMDTSDALFSMKSREDKLKIMKESHVGAFAVIILLFFIGLKFFFLKNIIEKLRPKEILGSIIIMYTITKGISAYILSNTVYLVSLKKGEDEKPTKGNIFCTSKDSPYLGKLSLVVALFICLFSCFFLSVSIIPIIVTFFSSLAIRSLFVQRFQGINGDMLGFIICVGELVFLFSLVCV